MLQRLALLCLSLWLIAASGLSAHAGPCHEKAIQTVAFGMTEATLQASTPAVGHDHCDMMAAPSPTTEVPAELPDVPPADVTCCCPAVLAALPAELVPEATRLAFALPASFPLDASAPSQTLIPEPPPPKA